ncbi:flavin oxidoreductase [Cribrihabitans marinus]|nr:flavin oxidoreductase [Cribrihabitans marinus]
MTVVTAATAEGPLAITVNSFTSVSLDPPLILWCVATGTNRYPGFAAAERFAVHVMAEDQQDTALSFARDGVDFDHADWTEDAHGTPVLRDCLARFDCRRHSLHQAGDHAIIVGEVLRAMHRPGKGLMFKRGQYGGFTGLV